jgi:LPPG:FO 2-phospho-L-lactate transferase
LTVVVNVGDNTERYGVHIAADPDTVLYTLADVAGPQGWGRSDDTFVVMQELGFLGVDTTMSLGDRDMAVCAYRTARLRSGDRLSAITKDLATSFGLDDLTLTVATDDPLETYVQTTGAEWLDFQTYFVDRHHADEVEAIAYHGSATAQPAPGVVHAIESADLVVIAPSNPPLSIWPILAVDGIEAAVRSHPTVAAVSPLFGGAPLKGPADAVMAGLGLRPGTAGILDAYDGLIGTLFIDEGDQRDVPLGMDFDVEVVATDTRLDDEYGSVFARFLVDHIAP